ncbi:hypothetical protein DXN05_03170 [Deminuibacter soli]|uniref:Uncharacterized protein n=1 Tax=Deminuibacter soli TaxID=2291815 RepID=A0A3E1NQ07_9BACT|nr:hypothetical protein DXN05_03170 [Deminuibacter soli]
MRSPNRDLLVLTKNGTLNARELEHEVELLHELLYHAESMEVFCVANEVIDISRHKILSKPYQILRVAGQRVLKPFVFMNNKN